MNSDDLFKKLWKNGKPPVEPKPKSEPKVAKKRGRPAKSATVGPPINKSVSKAKPKLVDKAKKTPAKMDDWCNVYNDAVFNPVGQLQVW